MENSFINILSILISLFILSNLACAQVKLPIDLPSSQFQEEKINLEAENKSNSTTLKESTEIAEPSSLKTGKEDRTHQKENKKLVSVFEEVIYKWFQIESVI